MNKLQLAMNAGARAIENNKKLDGTTYVYDVFSEERDVISYREASEILRKEAINNGWIPVTERLPEDDNPVIVTARRKDGARGYFIYKACYNAYQTHTTEDYGWDTEYIDTEYDEENDCYWVPECWYEDNAISDNGNYIMNDEFDVIAWQPLPEPYKETL